MSRQFSDEESIFESALRIDPDSERRAYLDEVCGTDSELRSRLDALLEGHFNGAGFMDADPARDDSSGGAVPDETGRVIGRYRLVERLGEGGFGVVYRAAQEEPIRREVALKVIKPGMDTRQVLARFETERQAMGMMDHTNIAKVYDAGATENGRPFFVMELVPGLPVTRFCDEHGLSPRRRLELFLDVCGAVQHAHLKGIIHRDLKPSNILCRNSPEEAKPEVKVIDFGIAKATEASRSGSSSMTQGHQPLGTPEYMSPEQADPGRIDVDTRSDIYSLGIVLYELLTGRTPLDGSALRPSDYEEFRRRIREEEPAAPSRRVEALDGDEREGIAEAHGRDPAGLAKMYREDLDWVVLKTLEKDPDRRYQTVSDLGADLRRFLRHEPVSAAAPSRVHRLRRFVRRNRAAVSAGLSVVVALLAGTVVAGWQAIRASQALEAAARQKDVAEAVNRFLTEDLLRQADAWRSDGPARADRTMVEMLSAATNRIGDRFSSEPVVEASIRLELGRAFSSLGKEREGIGQLRLAADLFERSLGPDHPSTLDALADLAWHLSSHGDPGEAGKSESGERLENVLAARTRVLGEDHPKTLQTRLDLAHHYLNRGESERAVPLVEGGYPICLEMAGSDHDLTLQYRSATLLLLQSQDRIIEANRGWESLKEDYRRIFGPDNVRIAYGSYHLGYNRMRFEGRYDVAERTLKKGLDISRPAVGYGYPTQILLYRIAEACLGQGKYEEGMAWARECLAAREALYGPDSPMTVSYGRRLASICGRLGDWTGCANEIDELRRRGIFDLETLAWGMMARNRAGLDSGELRQEFWEHWTGDRNENSYGAALILLMLPCPESERDSRMALVQDAVESLEEGRWLDAEKARLLQGILAFRKGEHRHAVDELHGLHNFRENWAAAALARYVTAECLDRLGQVERAKTQFDSANLILEGILSTGDLDSDVLWSLFPEAALALVARDEVATRFLEVQDSRASPEAKLAASRNRWGEVRKLLREADLAGRRRDYATASDYYIQAIESPHFDFFGGLHQDPQLDIKMGIAFLLGGKGEAFDEFRRLADADPAPVSSSLLVLRDDLSPPVPGSGSAEKGSIQAGNDSSGEREDAWDPLLEGANLYRAGRFLEAWPMLEAAKLGGRKEITVEATAWGAMAAFRSGRRQEAREQLALAKQGLKEVLDLNEGVLGHDWHETARCELVLKEAERFLGE